MFNLLGQKPRLITDVETKFIEPICLDLGMKIFNPI